MKTAFTLLLCLGLSPGLGLLRAQEPQPVPEQVAAPAIRLTQEELATLLGPIALYPDPLLSIILPASTFPSDIVLAARFAESGADPALTDDKPWDSSVKSLARYPDTLKWLDENLEWTTQVGEAYLAQPEDVMDVVQDLRRKAQTAGNLVDTPQQRIVKDETYVRIVPAQPEYIYVPEYDPEIVYIERPVPVARPLLSFSTGFVVGSWLNFDFDWHHRRLYCGDWHRDRGWDYDRHHHHRDHDRDRGRGDVRINNNNTTIVNNTTVNNININNNITNVQVWQGDARRRLAATRSLTAARSGFDRNRDGIRDLPRDGVRNNPIAVARPRSFTEVAARTTNFRRPVDEDGRRPFNGFNGGRGNDRDRDSRPGDGDRGKGIGNNSKGGKGGLVMPRTEAPVVVGDGRPGGKGGSNDPRGRDGFNPGSNGRDGRPSIPGLTGNNGKGGDRDRLSKDPKIPDRTAAGNQPPERPGLPVVPGVKDRLPEGRPSVADLNDGGKPGDRTKDSKVRDPKVPFRPGISQPRSENKDPNVTKRDDFKLPNADRTPDTKGRPQAKDSTPGGIPRPQVVMPSTPGPNQRDDDDNKPDRPGNGRGSIKVPEPRRDMTDVTPPKARLDDGRDLPKPKPQPPVSMRKDPPKSQASVPVPERRDMPKSQIAPPMKRDMPKPPTVVHRDPPKPKVSAPQPRNEPRPQVSAPPVKREPAPKPRAVAPMKKEPPKAKVATAPPVRREVSKPRPSPPKASIPTKRSEPKPQVAPKRSPAPKVHAPAPKPKPQSAPAKKPSSKKDSDDKKKR